MPKEPTKRELLERIERLEKQVDDMRVDKIIDSKDGTALTEYLMEAAERGNRKRQAAGMGA